MTRLPGIVLFLCAPLSLLAQGGDKEMRANADALFAKGLYADAFPSYQTLVGNAMEDFDLNFRYGVCALHAAADKDEAVKYLKRSTLGPAPPALAWYFLGKAHHLSYRFKDALQAYERFRGTADRKTLSDHPIDALELQCRNGQNLLANLKEIDVHNKVEVDAGQFQYFYDLSNIGGKILETPPELLSSLDRKRGGLNLVYIPTDRKGPIYFSSYGKGGETGRDIYRTEYINGVDFAPPVKLAGYINTAEDEDFAFMAPDGKTFYFCSKGHNSMGGYDVFKSTYDKGLDVFGAPVNMDFAVNTPDDDMLYLTDPEGKEACFASARDSKQGAVHVYRVSTQQSPVNITVLKGTFASQFDEKDRKAHVIVLDALTQETVADVKTDQNGDYVLALPRSGRYRFMVEAGPSGKTHVGMVDVPRNDEPRAYRQELTLVDQGGEKLMIRNYFDTPLEEDLIALALEEIKRRAKLDVGTRVIAEEPPPVQPAGDPLTRAGFAGDMTSAKVQEVAAQDALTLARTVDELDQRSKAAYSIAFENAALAEQHAQRAQELVAQANAITEEAARNERMTQAARERRAARTANQRAKAALRAAEDLTAERMAAGLKAAKAEKLKDDLAGVMAGADDNAKVIKLVELKTRLDEKNAPDGSISAEEKMRRAATEHEREAAAMLQRANAARGDENELADRVARKQREENEAKGGKKQNLARERAELQAQLDAMHQENERAFIKAKAAERETTTARGQAALAKYLATTSDAVPVTELTAEQIAVMGQRIGGTESRMTDLALDARFDAAIALEAREMEQRTFDWGTSIDGADQYALAANTTIKPDADGAGTTDRTQDGASTRDIDQNGSMDAAATDAKDPVPTETVTAGDAGTTTAPDDLAQSGNAPAEPKNGTTDQGTPQAVDVGFNPGAPSTQRGDTGTTNAAGAARTDVDLASMRGVVTTPEGSTADNATEAEGRVIDDGSERVKTPTKEEIAFMQANELAELKQVRAVEKNKARKDSLDTRIAALEAEMRAAEDSGAPSTDGPVAENSSGTDRASSAKDAGELQAPDAASNDTNSTTGTGTESNTAGAEPVAAKAVAPAADRPALDLAATTSDDQIIASVYPDYVSSKSRIVRDMEDPVERGTGLHGLELMLMDSIDAESARQVAYLEAHPAEAPQVLPRIDRLRQLKEAHARAAEAALADTDREYAAQESRSLEDAAMVNTTSVEDGAGSGEEIAASTTPHNDSYVDIAEEPEQVYTSVMEHRAPKADEAVREKDKDVMSLTGLEDRIDSLEEVLEGMPRGKDYEKLRDKTDRLIDDHMILRSEIGQRMAYITRMEYEAAQDSSKELSAATTKQGFAPSEPVLVLAKEFEASAKRQMDQALRTRKDADRSEDIVRRDSLLRLAYTQELAALREMDRSLTVRNHLLSDDFRPNERLTYEEIERRMFGPEEAPAIAGANNGKDNAGTDNARAANATGSDAPATAITTSTTTANDPLARARYKEFFTGDTTSVLGAMTEEDASALRIQAQQATAEARELENRSVALADRASSLQDSAATARRADRERLEREASRTRVMSDSLHRASVMAGEKAAELDRMGEQVAQTSQFNERLLKYYYLNDQEQALVLNEEDRSRYFQAISKAIEQREEAVQAGEQAASNKQLADALLKQSADILGNPDATGAPLTPEQMARASQLTDQAVRLTQRSDSLRRVNERLNTTAAVNEAQAASVLQSLDPQRGTEIMALEQRSRRVEQVLADARSARNEPASPSPSNSVTSGTNTGQAQQENTTTGTLVDGTSTTSAAGTGAEGAPDGKRTGTTTTDQGTTTGVPDASRSNASTGMDAASQPTAARPMEAGAPVLLQPLVADVFAMNPAEAPRLGPIPMDQPMPEGVVFKVQVGAFRHEVPQALFSDMAPVTGESVGNGLTRYTAGMFTSAQSAARATEQVRQLGYRDAFVVAYQDGRRVPLAQAMRAARPVGAASPDVLATTARPATEIRVPSAPATISAAVADSIAAADAEVLAKYPVSAQDVLAQFAPPTDATAYYNDPKAAPARQVETVKGLFFTVQVGVYSKPTALDKLFNITPLNSERTESNKIRYTTGVFVEMDKARSRKDETVGLGVKDAFITAYLNGKRIPMRDARALIARFGQEVFADPALITR